MSSKNDRQFWDWASHLYDVFMKKNKRAYDQMYGTIRKRLKKDMCVLEIATGTGSIALSIADSVHFVEATDYSFNMIKEAKKKIAPSNIHFAVCDACHLPYLDKSFDAVIVANALHIMPEPKEALSSIKRVLKNDGVLIAPTFTHQNSKISKIKATLMGLFGFRVYHAWTTESYCRFLEENGFDVEKIKILKASFPLTYVEAFVK